MTRASAKDVDALERGVRGADRASLARAITLVESEREQDRLLATRLLERLKPHTGGALRLGISGVPGAGKSTLIDALGVELVQRGHRLAVLAVDPSSQKSGGSILGDKTRMARLAQEQAAFIRPSPSGKTLGGVARKTRESMLVCEAAGYDLIFVETVGVGQSETRVADMVDLVVLLLLAGAGDELQGIKRGVLEVADAVVIQKADADAMLRAARARKDLTVALSLLRGADAGGPPPVMLTSAVEGTGLTELFAWAESEAQARRADGRFDARRREQALSFFSGLVDEGIRRSFRQSPEVAGLLPKLEADVAAGALDPAQAADALLAAFRKE
ncbi:MAG: methylmalonyl Co-A mutase-associated GTPase MeaB [Deltaproteobacteria bacterium]|nr:methylmalonyl Co-A mutase-associated GTPase MeaB [Deltaproteobacteria bacterium]